MTSPTSAPLPTGHDLEGREILIRYNDAMWYDAIVIRYYPSHNEYKIVYRADDGLEITDLNKRSWVLGPKKKLSDHDNIVLDGCILEFDYPGDNKRYNAMVYDYSSDGIRLKVAYINEHSTDCIKGGGWVFLTKSPCVEDDTDAKNTHMESKIQGSTTVENRNATAPIPGLLHHSANGAINPIGCASQRGIHKWIHINQASNALCNNEES